MKVLIISIVVIYTISLALVIYEIINAPLVEDDIKEWK